MGGPFAFPGIALPAHSGSELRAKQRVEGWVEFGGDGDAAEGVLVVGDEDPAKQRQIELFADVVWGGGVGVAAVLGQIERAFQVLLDNIEVCLRGGEFLVDAEQRCADAVLFAGEEIDGDGSGVVGFHELVLLSDELLLLDLQRALFFLDLDAGITEFFEDGGFNTCAE